MSIYKSSYISNKKTKNKNSTFKKKSQQKKQYIMQNNNSTNAELNNKTTDTQLENRKAKAFLAKDNTQNSSNKAQQYYKGSIVAAAAATGIATGVAVGVASAEELSQPFDKSQFSHLLQKDVPIDQLTIISEHNAGSLVGHGTLAGLANQNISIAETLDTTPVRSFDIDVWKHHGDLVVNHGNIYDPFVADNQITKLQDSLEDINSWLGQSANQKEAIFLNFENQQNIPSHMLENIFGENTVLTPNNFDTFFPDKLYYGSSAPTIHELTEKGIKIVVMHSDYVTAGQAVLKISDYHTINNTWEDRSLIQYLHGLHDKVAGKITTGDVDRIIASKHGGVLSLDKISEHDPRFYTPEQRLKLGLKPDIEIGGRSYSSSDSFNATFLGLGTAAAAGTAALSGIMGAFQGYANEMHIKKQDKILPSAIANIELGRVLALRQKQQKKAKQVDLSDLTKPVSINEVKDVYKKEKLFHITKNTIIPGGSATIGILSSMLALGLLFPPLMAIFFGIAATIAGAGLIAVAVATATNRKRLNSAINKAFQLEAVNTSVQKRVDFMNNQLNNNTLNADADPQDANEYINKLIAIEKTIANLALGVNTTTATMLLARISSFGKYVTPFIGFISGGVCSILTTILIIFNAMLNFRNRRNQLINISQFVIENNTSDYTKKQKRKLMIFGKTAIERFVYKDEENLIKMLAMPSDTKFDDAFTKLMLPENEFILEKYLIAFTTSTLTKELTKLAKQHKPPLDLQEVIQDKNQLNKLLKQYMVNKSCKFASRSTWMAGIQSLISLVAVGFFCGLLFTPLIAVMVASGIGIIGLITTKVAAMNESRLFRNRITDILSADLNNLNKVDLLHRKDLDNLLASWNQMFYKAQLPSDSTLTLSDDIDEH